MVEQQEVQEMMAEEGVIAVAVANNTQMHAHAKSRS